MDRKDLELRAKMWDGNRERELFVFLRGDKIYNLDVIAKAIKKHLEKDLGAGAITTEECEGVRLPTFSEGADGKWDEIIAA